MSPALFAISHVHCALPMGTAQWVRYMMGIGTANGHCTMVRGVRMQIHIYTGGQRDLKKLPSVTHHEENERIERGQRQWALGTMAQESGTMVQSMYKMNAASGYSTSAQLPCSGLFVPLVGPCLAGQNT